MTDAQETAFTDVVGALLSDADDDVTLNGDALLVKGRLFAVRSADGELVVDLPKERAKDLVDREIATEVEQAEPAPKGAWVAVTDQENWLETATEAHQFVGEPAVGGES